MSSQSIEDEVCRAVSNILDRRLPDLRDSRIAVIANAAANAVSRELVSIEQSRYFDDPDGDALSTDSRPQFRWSEADEARLQPGKTTVEMPVDGCVGGRYLVCDRQDDRLWLDNGSGRVGVCMKFVDPGTMSRS